MQPPSGIETPDQLAAGAIEKQQLGLDPLHPAKRSGEGQRIEAAGARVHRDSSGDKPALAVIGDEAGEQIDGQVVDNLPAHILERVEDGRLARAGHAGDEQQARQAIWSLLPPAHFNPNRSSASETLDGAEAVRASTLIIGTERPQMMRSRASLGKR